MYTIKYKLGNSLFWTTVKKVQFHQPVANQNRMFIKTKIGGIELPYEGLQIKVGKDWEVHCEKIEKDRKQREMEEAKK